ncbi:aminoacyl-tRNA hydrolase [Saccharopolyspora sp. WRP15-2]|uniref:peptidyl-tRNA hydrolase n=1 Tax=Saccharopolyspora oryzae TaxID=2997343 RepID=A0ABT4UYW7_9PSEU|nr:aminoacyl-tRNA hydrolase [Saccharopolyspora oryzae]MDA3626907.1 aminoacyl-tRNA hydrolase [Saccharopolyspora oryzae]
MQPGNNGAPETADRGVLDTAVLDPLITRYASWLALPGAATADTSDEDPENVVLMPMVLRIERRDPPDRTALLEAAAAAALAVCLDERCKPGGEWHEAMSTWIAGRIRKVSRRARGAHWEAVQSLPGRTFKVGNAEVRAFLPMRVADMPKELSRLQISGSELDSDEPGPPLPNAPVLWLNPDVPMSAGKSAAQVGHATMILASLLHGEGMHAELESWAANAFRCSVRQADAETWSNLHPGDNPEKAWREARVGMVRDAGFTEVDPGTVTVLAQWR